MSNTLFGDYALDGNSGIQNSAFGTSSISNSNSGNYNSGLGAFSLANNTTGSCDTSVGTNSLLKNTSGTYNTAIGTAAMCYNTTGNLNTALGSNALETNTIGEENTAVGVQALYSNISGDANTAVGYSALQNTTGSNNTALGNSAYKNGEYSNSTAIGYDTVVTASNQVVLGTIAETLIVPGINKSTVPVTPSASGSILFVPNNAEQSSLYITDSSGNIWYSPTFIQTIHTPPSTFAYGSCEYNGAKCTQNQWLTMPVSTISNTSLATINSNGGLVFNKTGIYTLTTNLSFNGYLSTQTDYVLAFGYSTAVNSNTSSHVLQGALNTINGGIMFNDNNTNYINSSTVPLVLNMDAIGGRGNYENGMSSSNYGANMAAITNVSNTLAITGAPIIALLPNYSSGGSSFPGTGTTGENNNFGLNCVNCMMYILAGSVIYNNITIATPSSGDNIGAFGNITVQLMELIN